MRLSTLIFLCYHRMYIISLMIIICKLILHKIKYYYKLFQTNEHLVYPEHIAFIMDGNGRWAKEKNKDRSFGHLNGANHLIDIFYNCFSKGSNYLTFYVFSEQNWKRPKEEVSHIFNIIYKKLKLYEGIPYRIIVQGKLDNIPKKLKKLLNNLMDKTKEYKKTIILCIDYSGRNEILHACKQLIDHQLEPTLENFTKNLYVKDIPDPDLIIRTSGEKRISDFLLWQLSYSEFYFSDVYWPDFDLKELEKAVKDYNSRHRRFGAI
jgi:undecaprenyl diphosphate synthase